MVENNENLLCAVRGSIAYDIETGIFSRKKKWGRAEVGSVLGCRDANGYVRIAVAGQVFLAHRLAWFYVHGQWPAGQIDHANGDRSDNRLENLRLCTNQQNSWNSRKKPQNSSGRKGVCWDRYTERWKASITVNSKHVHLGRFDTPEEAHAAYKAAALKLHGDFARIE